MHYYRDVCVANEQGTNGVACGRRVDLNTGDITVVFVSRFSLRRAAAPLPLGRCRVGCGWLRDALGMTDKRCVSVVSSIAVDSVVRLSFRC